MRLRRFVDALPTQHHSLVHAVGLAHVAGEHLLRDVDPVAGSKAQHRVIEAGLREFVLEKCRDCGVMGMRLQHREIAVAENVFDLPVLP